MEVSRKSMMENAVSQNVLSLQIKFALFIMIRFYQHIWNSVSTLANHITLFCIILAMIDMIPGDHVHVLYDSHLFAYTPSDKFPVKYVTLLKHSGKLPTVLWGCSQHWTGREGAGDAVGFVNLH